ncbi:unnamed protein product [Peronospora effusa]|nr:unnamed protein product [Peronospora effusa]
MPVKPKKTPLTKALMVIMLVVRSTMGMATADLSPEDALRTFQASDTLDMNLTPHASKQKRNLETLWENRRKPSLQDYVKVYQQSIPR